MTNGYRDQAFGGGAIRPSSDKPQSKLWYTDGQWFAGMFVYKTTAPTKSEFHIFRLDKATHSWVDTGVVIDTRDQSTGDYLWNEALKTLWVASTYPVNGPATIDDGIKVFKYTYNAATNTYTAALGFPVAIPGTVGNGTAGTGGSASVTIDRDSSGRLWAAWAVRTKVLYSTSINGGATWTAPAQVPTQAANPVREETGESDIASVIAFGQNVGIGWSDHDGSGATPGAGNGYYFSVIAAGAAPTVGANWSLEKLPTLVQASPSEVADNHLNFKASSSGAVYMVGKTRKDTADCVDNPHQPLVPFFRRTIAGVWSTHLVGTAGDCNTRPQLVISEQLNAAWVFLTSPNGGGVVYTKSAPLSGPGALVFRGSADETIQRGTPFIRSATETAIDDPTTGKQPVTAASGIVVLANNVRNTTSGQKSFYLHNEMSIQATDTTAPAGSVAIRGGSAHSATQNVTVSVAATDAGSGVSLVRLSNSSATTSGVLTSGSTFSYMPSVPWVLPAGDGVKTVYVQWRDAAGNWSGLTSDTITLDKTPPTGTVTINGGAAATTTRNVTLNLSASDGAGASGVNAVLISNSTDFSAATRVAYATSVPWTLSAGDGTKTVYVKFVDAVGNTSASPVSDTIALDAPPTGTVLINGGKAGTKTTAVSLTFPNTASDVTHVRAASPKLVGGELWQAYSPGMTLPMTLSPAGEGTKTVQAQFRDGSGTVSSKVSDTIVLDTTRPAKPSVPVHSLSNPVSAKVNVHLTWTGTDTAGSKFASYAVRQSVDGSGFTILGYPTTAKFDVPVDPAKNYVFQVATIDGAGNVSSWATSATIRAENHAETSAAVAYTGSWSTQTLTSYMGGTAKASSTANATATFTFTGRQVAWLSRLSNINGQARVYVDNVLIATVNTFSSTTQPKRVVFTRKFSTVATRKLKIVVVGTAGHPRITVDQFFVLR